jgi:hypothetical protein
MVGRCGRRRRFVGACYGFLAPVVVESKQKVGRFDKVNRRFPN